MRYLSPKALALFALLGVALATGCGKDNKNDVDLCNSALEHAATCCTLSANELAAARSTCTNRSFTDAQRQIVSCALEQSCQSLNGGACGGLTCPDMSFPAMSGTPRTNP